MRSRVGRESEPAAFRCREPARGEGTALLVCSAQPWAAQNMLPTPLVAWRPGQRHPSADVGEQVVLPWLGVSEREGVRAEVPHAGGGGQAAWTPHHILLSATAPRPPADFSGAIKCCLKCVLSLIQKKTLEKQSSENTVGCLFSWTSIHCRTTVSRAILDAGPHSSS